MVGRIDETPVRGGGGSGPVGQPTTPGTPGNMTGQVTPLRIAPPNMANVQKYASRLRRLLGMPTASPVDGYLTDVLPALLLNQVGPEDVFPEELRFAGGVMVALNGGFGSTIWVNGPAQAGFLAVIDTLTISRLNTAGEVDVFWSPPPGSSGLDVIPLDARGTVTAGLSLANLVNLTGSNTAALVAKPSSFFAFPAATGAAPVVLHGIVLPAFLPSAPNVLTIQPSIIAEGVAVMIEGRILRVVGS